MKIMIIKTGKLNFTHGPESVNSHADGHSDDSGFGQGRIDHPRFPELLKKTFGNPEDPAVQSHVFPQNNHPVVFFSPAAGPD